MCSAVQITIPMRRKAKRGDFPFLDPDLYSTPSSTLRTKGVEAGHVFTTHYCNTVCMVKVRLLLTGHNNVNVATKLPDWFDWHENRRKIFQSGQSLRELLQSDIHWRAWHPSDSSRNWRFRHCYSAEKGFQSGQNLREML